MKKKLTLNKKVAAVLFAVTVVAAIVLGVCGINAPLLFGGLGFSIGCLACD